MNSSPTQDPFPDENFLEDTKGNNPSFSFKNGSLHAHGYLFPIDEAEEFHDPFSDLSLFLSKRIKRELLREKNPRKWSQKIQSILLKEILPEFTKKFPKYRLGNSALKKTWDKVLYHLQLIQQEKNAIRPDGKLNIDHFIKQNLKRLSQNTPHADLHPYNAAHSLAVKISECIAAIDGERPKLDELTQTIWAVQRHIIPQKDRSIHSSFEKVDMLDKLMMRLQLETIIETPYITQEDLIKRIRHKLKGIKQLQKLKDDLYPYLASILAEKLGSSLSIYQTLSPSSIESLFSFIENQMKLAPKEIVVKRILLLYPLASKISLEEAKVNFKAAIEYVLSIESAKLPAAFPVLHQDVFSCIEGEIALARKKGAENVVETTLETLLSTFLEAKSLPALSESARKDLEILIWKDAHKSVPLYLKEIVLQELAGIYIDHPDYSFQEILSSSLYYFKKVGDIDLNVFEKRAKNLSIQNDMLYSLLSFDDDSPFLAIIHEVVQTSPKSASFDTIIESSLAHYLKGHPELSEWESHIRMRMTFMYKYFWYTKMKQDKESAYDRFLTWHFRLLLEKKESLFSEILLTHLEHLKENLVPLFPFHRDHVRALTLKIAAK